MGQQQTERKLQEILTNYKIPKLPKSQKLTKISMIETKGEELKKFREKVKKQEGRNKHENLSNGNETQFFTNINKTNNNVNCVSSAEKDLEQYLERGGELNEAIIILFRFELQGKREKKEKKDEEKEKMTREEEISETTRGKREKQIRKKLKGKTKKQMRRLRRKQNQTKRRRKGKKKQMLREAL